MNLVLIGLITLFVHGAPEQTSSGDTSTAATATTGSTGIIEQVSSDGVVPSNISGVQNCPQCKNGFPQRLARDPKILPVGKAPAPAQGADQAQ